MPARRVPAARPLRHDPGMTRLDDQTLTETGLSPEGRGPPFLLIGLRARAGRARFWT